MFRNYLNRLNRSKLEYKHFLFFCLPGEFDFDIRCEPDEYALLVEDLRKSGIMKKNRKGLLTTYNHSFSGKDFVDWVTKAKNLGRHNTSLLIFLE